MRSIGLFVWLLLAAVAGSDADRHTFALGTDEFLLDEKPFQMISGEMHPIRRPA